MCVNCAKKILIAFTITEIQFLHTKEPDPARECGALYIPKYLYMYLTFIPIKFPYNKYSIPIYDIIKFIINI